MQLVGGILAVERGTDAQGASSSSTSSTLILILTACLAFALLLLVFLIYKTHSCKRPNIHRNRETIEHYLDEFSEFPEKTGSPYEQTPQTRTSVAFSTPSTGRHGMATYSREAEAPIVMQSLETPPPPPQYHRRGSGVGTRFLSLQAETPIVMETPPPRQQRRGSVLGSSWRDEWPVGRAASYEWDDVQPQPEVPPTRFFV